MEDIPVAEEVNFSFGLTLKTQLPVILNHSIARGTSERGGGGGGG